MKQYQVPQFIDIEDKILGFVTMRQFFTMLIPLAAAFIFYFIFDLWLAIILFIPVLIGATVFAFIRPNGMKFSKFFKSFLSFVFKPHLYVWKQMETVEKIDTAKLMETAKEEYEGLKVKKGAIETGSKVNEKDLTGKSGSEYLDELLK